LHQPDSIQVLPSDKIDKSKWDACVRTDPGALIYFYSWYLDSMAASWSGIVVDDYRAVMPLPTKSKLGVQIVAIPAFVQRLGVAGDYNKELETRLYQEALSFKSLIQYAASEESLFPESHKRRRTNFIQPLDKSYEELAAAFTPACRKNINKSEKRGCVLSDDLHPTDVISLYRSTYGTLAAYTAEHFSRLEKMTEHALANGQCHVAGVKDSKGELVYAGMLLDDGKRLYYILGAPSLKGRAMRATYFFINEMIRKFAGSGKIFDFEGSDIPDVASFYQSFSPQTEYYYQFYINNYPFPLKNLLDLKLKNF
jgi:hypothetical protein